MKAEEIKRLRELLTPELELGPLKIFYTSELRELSEIALNELENNAKSQNEREEKSMLHNVTIKHEENKVLEWVWIMIAMRNSKLAEYDPKTKITKDLGEESRVMDKRELDHAPTLDEIAQFLSDSKADFVSVVQKYRFDGELPFC